MRVLDTGLQDPQACDVKQTADRNVYLVIYISVVKVSDWKCVDLIIVVKLVSKFILLLENTLRIIEHTFFCYCV